MLWILFGRPGVGKTYVGQKLAKEYHFHFYDADRDLTEDMIENIRQQKVFTTAMRHAYFTRVCERIQTFQKQPKPLVVAQALAKESNRLQCQQQFPHAQFVYIVCSDVIANARLQQRQDWVTTEYADKIRDIFEEPKLNHYTIENDGDDQQLQVQLKQLMHALLKTQ